MLPPPRSPRRDVNVSIRFSAPEYERLRRIADYRSITVAALLYHVVINAVLPKLEREVQSEQQTNLNEPPR
jgi:hypothetical protein